jgi:hypothetical protein
MAADEYAVIGDTVKRQAERLKSAAQRKLDQQFTGRLSSGAAAKVAAKTLTDIDVGTQDQLAKLDYEKAAKGREERLIKEGQTFQTSEREGTQAFAGDEAQRNRSFAREERLGTQSFKGEQSNLDRKLQESNINLGYEQLRTQQQQFASEFEENVRTGLFNKIVALKDIDSSTFNRILDLLGRSGAEQGTTKDYLGNLTGIPVTDVRAPYSGSGFNFQPHLSYGR